jgi:hypothetical protein
MVLHGIEAPNLVHANTLNENVMDIQETERHDIILANPTKTRHDRADSVRQDGLTKADGDMKGLLLAILSAYETGGESELATKKLTSFLAARFGSVSEGKAKLGGFLW